MSVQVIERTISSLNTTIDFIEYLRYQDFTLRIRIRSHTYRFQSYAILEVFHIATMSWSEVVMIHQSQMETVIGVYQNKPFSDGDGNLVFNDSDECVRFFKRDREHLLSLFDKLFSHQQYQEE